MSIRAILEAIPGLRRLVRAEGELSLRPGDRLGRFEIREELPPGGMGLAYRAHDPDLGRDVVLKRLRPDRRLDAKSRSRFLREARTASRAAHPNVVTIYDLRRERGQPLLVMEHVRGRSLREVLREERFEPATVLHYASRILDGLGHLHSLGIVHRDLKPSNLMVTEAGDVKILDFGIARRTAGSEEATVPLTEAEPEELATGSGEILGTPAYMAPEQIRGDPVDARTDLFAFGCVLFEMLTGRIAFDAPGRRDRLRRILRDEPEWPPDFRSETREATRRIVARCLRKDPAERWPSASHIAEALREVRSGIAPGEDVDEEVSWLRRDLILARTEAQVADVRLRAERLLERDPDHLEVRRLIERLERAALADVSSAGALPERAGPLPEGTPVRRHGRAVAAAVLALGVLAIGTWTATRLAGNGEAPSPPIAVSGRVVGPDDHPISGARVTVDGYPRLVTTTSEGDFVIELPDARPGQAVRLRVTHDSLATFTTLVPLSAAGPESLRIELEGLDRD
jgi:predicted Ser/Thr protein kinase